MIGAGREVEARMVAARTAAARASSQGESALVLLDARRAEVRTAIARYCARSGVQTARVSRAVKGALGAYGLGAAAGARADLTPNSRTLAGRS